MDLDVPYSEKDEAKRLGARWNPERRVWYVPEGVDPRPFSRWWITQEAAPAFNLYAPEAYLVSSPERCWRCSAPVTVIGFLLAPGFEANDVWESDEGEALDDWQRYDDWSYAHYIAELPPDIADIASAASPHYRPAFSKTIQGRYWANHCPSCGVLQGDFGLFCEPGGAFLPMAEWEVQDQRAARLAIPFEATAEFSFGIEVATSIPGVRDSRPASGAHYSPDPARFDPSSSPRPKSLLSRMAEKLFGGKDARASTPAPRAESFAAVLIDPFAREIRGVDLPTYPVDEHNEVADQAAFRRAIAQWQHHIGDDIPTGSASFRHDCMAMIDDEGLLRADAAYWRLEIGPEEERVMRGGRYLVYGYDGTSAECAVPVDLDVDFWRRHVRWVDDEEGRAWCREHGIESPRWQDR